MERRTLLSTLILGMGGISGCLSSTNGSRPETCDVKPAENSPLPVSTITESDSFVLIYPPDGPIMEIRVGDPPPSSDSEPADSIGVWVYNLTPDPLGVETSLMKGESSADIFVAECGLKPDEFVAFAILEPDQYTVRTQTDTGLGPHPTPIRENLFNDNVTYTIEIREDGIEAFASGPG